MISIGSCVTQLEGQEVCTEGEGTLHLLLQRFQGQSLGRGGGVVLS